MSKSRRLTLSQVRAAYRLVEECREMGDDLPRWRRHLATGINDLIGTFFTLTYELKRDGPDGPQMAGFVEVGLPIQSLGKDLRRDWDEYLQHGKITDNPFLARLIALPGPRVTRRVRELLNHDEHYRSDFFLRFSHPAGMDDGAASLHAMSDGWVFGLGPGRATGDRPFGRRDAKYLHFLQLLLAPHLGRSLATTRDPVSRLSPRLRQTLDCLLEGDSEKQVAARLRISVATIREYVQALYRQFDVTTRAELMAYFLRRYRRPPDPPVA